FRSRMACCSCGVIVSCWPIFRTSDGFMADLVFRRVFAFPCGAPGRRSQAIYMPGDQLYIPLGCPPVALQAEFVSQIHFLDQLVGEDGLGARSEEHTSELQSRENLVCRLLLEKKKIKK